MLPQCSFVAVRFSESQGLSDTRSLSHFNAHFCFYKDSLHSIHRWNPHSPHRLPTPRRNPLRPIPRCVPGAECRPTAMLYATPFATDGILLNPPSSNRMPIKCQKLPMGCRKLPIVGLIVSGCAFPSNSSQCFVPSPQCLKWRPSPPPTAPSTLGRFVCRFPAATRATVCGTDFSRERIVIFGTF